MLQAVTGATPEMVQGILQQRRGSDDIEPSEDDLRFDDVGQVAGWLAGSTLPLEQIMGRLTTESSVKRIDSRGVVMDVIEDPLSGKRQIRGFKVFDIQVPEEPETTFYYQYPRAFIQLCLGVSLLLAVRKPDDV